MENTQTHKEVTYLTQKMPKLMSAVRSGIMQEWPDKTESEVESMLLSIRKQSLPQEKHIELDTARKVVEANVNELAGKSKYVNGVVNFLAPFYMLTGKGLCWSCKTPMNFHCLVASGTNEGFEDKTPFKLFCIRSLRECIMKPIKEHYPSFMKQKSNQFKGNYWGNKCLSCGNLQGDR